jgi:hypothetical protein
MDSTDILANASEGFVKGLALEIDVKLARMYELLSKDNPYPKLWRILRPLGRINREGLRLVQADFNARCAAILDTDHDPVSPSQLHKELSEVVQVHLDQHTEAEQRKEIIEAIALLQHRLNQMNKI